MKIIPFSSLLIILKSTLVTMYYSCATIILAHANYPNKRSMIDRCIRKWASALLRHAKVSFSVLNPYNVKFEPNKLYVLMSNHESHYDIPVLLVALEGSIRMLAKKELHKIPIFGRGMQAGEFVFIDRDNIKQAIKDLEAAKEKMKSGILLWIAPEGRRTANGELLPFKKGGFMVALQTGATIIPIGIRGTFEILKPFTWDFQIGKHAEVCIGKPIDASQYSLETRGQLMQDVEHAIRELTKNVTVQDGVTS